MLALLLASAVATVVPPESPKPYEVTAANELRSYLEKCVPSGKVTVGGGRGATALPAADEAYAIDADSSGVKIAARRP